MLRHWWWFGVRCWRCVFECPRPEGGFFLWLQLLKVYTHISHEACTNIYIYTFIHLMYQMYHMYHIHSYSCNIVYCDILRSVLKSGFRFLKWSHESRPTFLFSLTQMYKTQDSISLAATDGSADVRAALRSLQAGMWSFKGLMGDTETISFFLTFVLKTSVYIRDSYYYGNIMKTCASGMIFF